MGAVNAAKGRAFRVARETQLCMACGSEIDNGDSTPIVTDGTDFGAWAVGQSVTNVFTIANSGGCDLHGGRQADRCRFAQGRGRYDDRHECR